MSKILERLIKDEIKREGSMGCPECDKTNAGEEGIYYYRFKNANIGVMGCQDHVKQLFDLLNDISALIRKHGEK